MSTASRFLAALLLALPPVLLAQDDRAYAGHFHCFAFTPDQSTYYTTGVWDGTFFMQEVYNGFAQELLAKYGFKDRVSCSRANLEGSTLAKLTTDFQSQAGQWRARGAKVVEVNWKFDPAAAKLPYLCWALATVQQAGKAAHTQYVNQIIRLPGGTQAAATLAFAAHMKTLRPGVYFPVPGGCSLLPADPEAQQRQVDGTIAMYQSQKPELIRLTWSYVAP